MNIIYDYINNILYYIYPLRAGWLLLPISWVIKQVGGAIFLKWSPSPQFFF